MASSDMSIVSFEVDCMTDYQILFGAVVFKHLNTHPDVNWENVAKDLGVPVAHVQKHYEAVRTIIKMRIARAERLKSQGKTDTHEHNKPIIQPLAVEQGAQGNKKVFKAGETNIEDDKIEEQLSELEQQAQQDALEDADTMLIGEGDKKRRVSVKKLANGVVEVTALIDKKLKM